MRVSFESFHRPVKVRPTPAIVVVALLIIGAILAIPAPAWSNATTQRSATTMPQCTRPVTVHSNPCGAVIYIDGMQVGRTPMTFPMPTGRYTLVLLAPGHEVYAQRILVPDAPLEINANLAVEK